MLINNKAIGSIILHIQYTGGDTCDNKPQFKGAPVIAKAVMETRNNLTMSENVELNITAQVVPFGTTNLNLTLARVENCTKGGPLDICGICEVVS